jgi:multidrug efflux pump subunit AcrA (membrane-fusion protein)
MISNPKARTDIIADGQQTVFSFDFDTLNAIGAAQVLFFIKNEDGVVLQIQPENINVNLSAKTVEYPKQNVENPGAPMPAGTKVIIARYLNLTQGTNLSINALISVKAIESALDYEIMIDQQINDHIDDLLHGFDGKGVNLVNEKKQAQAAAAAAQQAQAGAQAAQQAAETAQTGAQTAQTAAETAQDGAVAAKFDAQAALAGAQTAQQAAQEAAQTATQAADIATEIQDKYKNYVDAQDNGAYTGLLSNFVNYGRYRGNASANPSGQVKPADYPIDVGLGSAQNWLLEVYPYYDSYPADDAQRVNSVQVLTIFINGLSAGAIVGVWKRNFVSTYSPQTGTSYNFTAWVKNYTMDDVNAAISAATAPLIAELADLQEKINSVLGKGRAITANDFGAAAPTQEQFIEYSLQDIFGDGGTFTYNSDNPSASTYVIDGDTHTASEVWDSTWVRNTNNGHRWVLVNTPDTDPAIYTWTDVGLDTFDETQFLRLNVAATQIINSDVALAKGKKLLGTKASGAEAIIAEYAIYNEGQPDQVEQLEIGSESEHLNLNTADDITCDTPSGKINVWGRADIIDSASTAATINAAAGITYRYALPLTSLTIQSFAISDNETKIYFTAAADFVLTLPDGFDFNTQALSGALPLFLTGKEYMISIDNGIFAFSQR